MPQRQELLDWKKPFLARVSDRSDKADLEQHFEQLVESLSAIEYQQALDCLVLWKQGKTDGEKFYFGKKIVELLQKRLPK